MARQDAIYDKYALFINSALLAVHNNHPGVGFRQKDVKFYLELLTNWMETVFKGCGLEVQNTQIQRLLDSMTSEGLLKKEAKKKFPLYSFTPIGLLEVITRLVSDDSLLDLQNFFFLYHVVSLYSNKMEDILLEQRSYLPKSYQLEIKHLLNPETLIERQKKRISIEIEKLSERIDEAYKMSELANTYIKKNLQLSEIIKKVESQYPYQLNNQKKMTELFKGLPPDVQLLEISKGPKQRAQLLWGPLLKNYQSYLSILNSL